MTFPAYPDKMEATKKGACMDMGSRRMQIVGIVLAVLMAAMLAGTLWAYRRSRWRRRRTPAPGLEPKVAVVVLPG